MRDFSAWLRQHVVLPLNERGVQVDLGDVQAVLLGLPILLVVAAFLVARAKKRRQMRDAGL